MVSKKQPKRKATKAQRKPEAITTKVGTAKPAKARATESPVRATIAAEVLVAKPSTSSVSAADSATKALTVAEQAKPAKGSRLSDTDRALLQSVVARAASVHETVESTWTDFGEWVFTQVFGEDSTSAIEHADDNPVYTELLKLADGPRVRVRPEDIERATLCAAYDKRLNNDSWRALNYGRKWRLLRLEDEKLLRKAAQHVLSSNLDTRGVETYVRNVLAERGAAIETRVNLRALTGQLQRVTERVSSDAFLKKLSSAAKELDEDQRERMMEQVDAARTALEVLHKKLSAKK